MKRIKAFFRYWIRRAIMWAALKGLTVYGAWDKISDAEESVKQYPTTPEEVKNRLAQMILTKLINEGVFEFHEERDALKMETKVSARLIVLK